MEFISWRWYFTGDLFINKKYHIFTWGFIKSGSIFNPKQAMCVRTMLLEFHSVEIIFDLPNWVGWWRDDLFLRNDEIYDQTFLWLLLGFFLAMHIFHRAIKTIGTTWVSLSFQNIFNNLCPSHVTCRTMFHFPVVSILQANLSEQFPNKLEFLLSVLINCSHHHIWEFSLVLVLVHQIFRGNFSIKCLVTTFP